jgi:DNA-binding MarR family transcriptional regulator
MWLESEEPFRKTDLYQFMPKVSQRTAAKYIQIAIDRGLLLERPDTEDRRSKRITIADDLKIRIERFLDYSIDVFNKGLK